MSIANKAHRRTNRFRRHGQSRVHPPWNHAPMYPHLYPATSIVRLTVYETSTTYQYPTDPTAGWPSMCSEYRENLCQGHGDVAAIVALAASLA